MCFSFFLISCTEYTKDHPVTLFTLDTHPNVIDFGNPLLKVEPREDKFKDGNISKKYSGRILVRTNELDTSYHTVVPTTMNNTVAQQSDGRIAITVHLPVQYVDSTVYFRVVDPDPDDDSPYEQDDSLGDNMDSFISNPAGVLSANSAVAVLATIDGKTCAAAEVVLDITKDFAGDNYQVEACFKPDFSENVGRSYIYTAWYRRYLEEDMMYKAGATVLVDIIDDPDNIPWDTIVVSEVDNFSPDRMITIFNNKGDTVHTTIRQVIGDNMITVDTDIKQEFERYSGINLYLWDYKLSKPPRRLIEDGFGKVADGREGGCFTEFVDAPLENEYEGIPKWEDFPDNYHVFGEYLNYWSSNSKDKNPSFKNIICMASVHTFDDDPNSSGGSAGAYHAGGVAYKYFSGIQFEEAYVHELGHINTPDPDLWYYDLYSGVRDYTGAYYCVMNYNNITDENVDFSEQALLTMRDDVDTLSDTLIPQPPAPEYPEYEDIELSILHAEIRFKEFVRGEREYVLHVESKLVNIDEDSIITTDFGRGQNYLRILAPDGETHRTNLDIRLLNPTKIYRGETKVWVDSILLYGEKVYRNNGVYKFYWVFHGKVLEQPIEIEKVDDRNFNFIKF